MWTGEGDEELCCYITVDAGVTWMEIQLRVCAVVYRRHQPNNPADKVVRAKTTILAHP